MRSCASPRQVAFIEAIHKHQENLRKRHLLSDFTGLNQVMGGGFESGLFYLLYGSSHIISSTLLSLAVAAQLPKNEGLDSSVVFIDNDNIFNPYTLIRLAHTVNLNPNLVLSRILVARAFIWNHLGEIVGNLETILEETAARIVLISGLTTLFEGEFEEKKHQMLLQLTNKLRNIASDHELIVVASAQLAQGSRNKPAGGKIIAHSPHVLIRVLQQGEQLTFTVMKHPSRAAVQTVQRLSRQKRAPLTVTLDDFVKPPLEE